MVRWISHLTDFGRMNDTLDRVEEAASDAVLQRLLAPWLGGRRKESEPPDGAHAVTSPTTGYVQHIDMGALSQVVREMEAEAWLAALPGDFVHPATPLVHVTSEPSDDFEQRLCDAITCGRDRSFEQDPRFGVIVLSEIASRALSPAVNDPGTAIDVLGRLLRVLSLWRRDVEAVCDYDNIHVPTLHADELIDLAIRPIARDGAGVFEVQAKIQATLTALSAADQATFGEPAEHWSQRSLDQAEQAGLAPEDLKTLQGVALVADRPNA